MSVHVSAEVVHANDGPDNQPNESINRVKDWLYKQPRFVKELVAGGVAGGSAKTCVAPLERTKILFQTGKLHGGGVSGTLMMLYETEGWQGLFRGNGASVIRIVPYAAINYSCYEYFRRLLLQHCLPAVTRIREGETVSPVPVSVISSELKTPLLGSEDQAQAQRRLDSEGASTSAPAKATGGRKQPVHPIWDLFAGSSAGAAAVLVTYPLDLARTRLACATEIRGVGKAAVCTSNIHNPFSSSAATTSVHESATSTSSTAAVRSSHSHLHSPPHPTIRSTLLDTVKTKGFRGLYHGVHPTLLGILPYAGLKFYCYQSFKHAYVARQHSLHEAAGSPMGVHVNTKPPVHVSLLFGGVAGLFAQTVTYPVDVLRRRMQMQGFMSDADSKAVSITGKLPGTSETCRMIFREEGWRGFFRGLSINYMKVIPCTAVGFTMYDHMKTYLGLENHI